MECFVPPGQFEPLLEELRGIILTNKVDLMNVTVRHVKPDDDTFLRYADKEMFALVMLFNQTRDKPGDDAVAQASRAIIAAALRHGGRYYLPYRLSATPEQFNAAYPQATEFFSLKRKYDPEELFQNEFYRQYSGRGHE
jgi:FAD/FMN-containing dehydrogenase